jgi:hypothetical protein
MAKIAKFSIVEKPNKKAVFRDLPGWKFDEGAWANLDVVNKDYSFPKKSDLDLTAIPETYYESGVVEQSDLEFDEINFEDQRLSTGWTPGVRRGQYFVHEKKYALHGSESITRLVKNDTPTTGEYDGEVLSVLNLNQDPHPLLPISAEYLTRDSVTLAVEPAQVFTKVVKFKGVASNGRELDVSSVSNIDTSVFQFRVERNNSEPELHSPILATDVVAGTIADVYLIENALSAVRWYEVKFSRPDIFRTELSYTLFNSREVQGLLAEGDYCIGYKSSSSDNRPIKVYLTVLHEEYGTVSYKPDCDAYLIFNQDVRLPKVETFANASNDTTFFLTDFPCLDLTSFDEDDFGGAVNLDISSTTMLVNAVDTWVRVATLEGQLGTAEVFTLDPLYGVIEVGDGVVGKSPVGTVEVTHTQVPLVQYDPTDSRELFDDNREDLDPQTNALKRGFLVLDNRRLLPYKIVLSASGKHVVDGDYCCYGPLAVPAASPDDILPVRARVLARGLPDVGVPNVPVQFKTPDDLVIFSQEFAITDGEGYAYTEAQGQGVFDNFIVTDHMYEARASAAANFLNPDPATLVLEAPPHFNGAKTLIVPERFDGTLDEVYLLIQSIRSDDGLLVTYGGAPLDADGDPEPYNGKTRKGGLTVVWSQTVSGAEEIVHPDSYANPSSDDETEFTFLIDIPTGDLIVGYKLVIDRSTQITACTTEAPILLSNSINVCMELNEGWKGQWKLPNLLDPDSDGFTENLPLEANTDSSRISSAVYMSPNDFVVTEIQPDGGGAPITDADVGDAIHIVGTDFPTQAELSLSIFIIKTDSDDEIIGVVNIDPLDITFVSDTVIRIASLPVPPTAEYDVDYWIAVGGFHPEDSTTNIRQTAVTLEIGAL